MPRDTIQFDEKSFTLISIDDIQRMEEHRLGGMTCRVYFILKQHCYNGKNTCFPSLRRISEMLGYKGDNYKQAIGRCLRELERFGFIIRNQARKNKAANTKRFVLLDRRRGSETKPSQDSETKPSQKKIKVEEEQLPPKSSIKEDLTNTNESDSSQKPKATRKPSKRKPRMTLEERRIRKHQRRQEANEERYRAYQEEQRKEAAAREEELIRQITEIKEKTTNLTDRMISLIGSRKIKDQYVLLLGRWHWERTRGDCWHYEPPTKEQIAADLNAVLEYAQGREAFKTDYHLFYMYSSQSVFWKWLKK